MGWSKFFEDFKRGYRDGLAGLPDTPEQREFWAKVRNR